MVSVDNKDVLINTGTHTGPQHFNVWQIKPCLLKPSHANLERNIHSEDKTKASSIAVQWTEVLSRGDPSANSPAMQAAIRDEMQGLIDRGTLSLVRLPDTTGLNVVPTELVLTVKHEENGQRYKARFCVGGYRDKTKSIMLHT